jgi:hypothetical protein
MTKMNSVLTRLAQYLTNSDYRKILFTLGRSERPLSGVEIEKRAELSRYVYDMLKELAPSEFNTDIRLFGWEEILQKNNDGDYKRQLIGKFRRTLNLDWEINSKDQESISTDMRNDHINKLIVFGKVDDDTLIIEHTREKEFIVIRLPNGRMILDDVHLSIRTKKGDELGFRKRYPNITLKNDRDGKLAIYTLKQDPSAPTKTRFLDVTLSREAKNKLSKIEQREDREADLIESCPEYKAIRSNRKNWRYSLTFYGFLLYLACEYETTTKGRRKTKNQKDRKDVRRIHRVISNPVILNYAPFLWYWKDFEDNIDGFKVDEILVEIGDEFKNQLDYDIIIEDKNYLLKRVTERYFAELYRGCYYNFGMGFISRWYANNKILQGKDTIFKNPIFKKLVEYRISILQSQKKWLTEEIGKIDILLSSREGRRVY